MPKYTLFSTILVKNVIMRSRLPVVLLVIIAWIIFAPDLEVSLEMSQRNEYTEMLKFCFGKLNL